MMLISNFSWFVRENGKYNVQKQYTTTAQQATTKLQDSMTRNTNNKKAMIHKRSTALKRAVRKSLEGFNMFDGTKPHPYFWCWSRQINVWFAWTISNLSMYHYVQK